MGRGASSAALADRGEEEEEDEAMVVVIAAASIGVVGAATAMEGGIM